SIIATVRASPTYELEAARSCEEGARISGSALLKLFGEGNLETCCPVREMDSFLLLLFCPPGLIPTVKGYPLLILKSIPRPRKSLMREMPLMP
ncbi:hypothetical protein SLA2020_380130, partial [Shorea laevis]